ncbi:MAG: hypothetical protein HYR56_12730 [Acidobacteria bacterium]|nr:hypothetical protein [Acidobacteriota bacterium]
MAHGASRAALGEVFPLSKQQLCWLPKMCNLLDKLPKKEHAEAVLRLRAIQRASSRSAAAQLFYDFPAEHWARLHTSDVIESLFAAVRLRTDAAKRFRTVKSGVHDLAVVTETGKEMAALQWG